LGAGVQVYYTLKSRIDLLVLRHFAIPDLDSQLC